MTQSERKITDKQPADRSKAADQQHTGNHERPAREREGNEAFGGTRAGADNVEPRR